jgi:hypothetical protein
MAPDFALPLEAIVLHAACELKGALAAFQNAPSNIKLPKGFPDDWSMSIQLTPKVDTDFNARLGTTGTSKGPGSTKTYFNTWTLGQAPGAGVDVKTWKNGGVTYYVSGKDLLNIPIDCENANANISAMAQDFGIRDWLTRLVQSTNQNALDGVVTFDKPTFGAEIIVRTDGTGVYTYNFPFGTALGTLGGWYEIDELLSISFTADPATPPSLVEFPPVAKSQGGKTVSFRLGVNPAPNAARTPRGYVIHGVSEAAKDRLDQIQNEQSLRNIQIRR